MKWLRNLFAARPLTRPTPRSRTVPRLEALEERCVPSTMTQITNASAFPNSAAVKVVSVFPNGQAFGGSGAMVDGTHVLTAGHMVFNASDGGWASQVTVYAGMTSSNNYVAEASAKWERTFTSFINDDYVNSESHDPGDGDIGLITLSTNIGSRTGWFGMGYDDGNSFAGWDLNTLGYPGVNYSGVNQYFQFAAITGTTGGTTDGFSSFYYSQDNIHEEGGQSGSPIYAYYESGPNAGQVVIYGVMDVENPDTGYAERITATVFNDLEVSIQSDNAGSNNSGAGQQREQITNPAASSNTTVSAAAATVTAGQAVTFYASVSGSGSAVPTGTVTFYDGTTKLGTWNLQPSLFGGGAYASFRISTLGVGSHTITAVYSGDGNFKGSHVGAHDGNDCGPHVRE